MNDEAISLSLMKRYEAAFKRYEEAFDLLNAEIASRDIQIALLNDLLNDLLKQALEALMTCTYDGDKMVYDPGKVIAATVALQDELNKELK